MYHETYRLFLDPLVKHKTTINAKKKTYELRLYAKLTVNLKIASSSERLNMKVRYVDRINVIPLIPLSEKFIDY